MSDEWTGFRTSGPEAEKELVALREEVKRLRKIATTPPVEMQAKINRLERDLEKAKQSDLNPTVKMWKERAERQRGAIVEKGKELKVVRAELKEARAKLSQLAAEAEQWKDNAEEYKQQAPWGHPISNAVGVIARRVKTLIEGK